MSKSVFDVQGCRAFTLALARLSCWNCFSSRPRLLIQECELAEKSRGVEWSEATREVDLGGGVALPPPSHWDEAWRNFLDFDV